MKDAKTLRPRLPEVFLRILLHSAVLVLVIFSSGWALDEEEALEITDLLLSNHTGTAFVLSWRTNKPTSINQVHYGLDRSNLDQVVNETKVRVPGRIHYAQLVHLKPNTTYYYYVKSDELEFSAGTQGVDSVRTFSQSLPPGGIYIDGMVTDQTGIPFDGVLVRSFLKWAADSSMWYTVISRKDGKFSMETANYRRYDSGTVPYNENQLTLHLEIMGETQEILRDSVLLTKPIGYPQDLGTYLLIDLRKKAVHGRIDADTPVLADGRAVSVVNVTILDDDGNPVPGVHVKIRPSGVGAYVEGPFSLTDRNGVTTGLVRSTVAETKVIRVDNVTADTTEIDTIARVNFLSTLDDKSQDTRAPWISSTTILKDTNNNVGPYTVTSKIYDNFYINAKLVYAVSSNMYSDTVDMVRMSSSLPYPDNPDADNFVADIPGQPYNSVVKYFVLAEDSSANKSSYPADILTDPLASPVIFEILTDDVQAEAWMGITGTTDAMAVDPDRPVRVETWVTSTVGISSAVIKWRNFFDGETFYDAPLSHYGAHYWGTLPGAAKGSSIEYFIQVVDSMGRLDRDHRRAPYRGLYSYRVIPSGKWQDLSFVDSTQYTGTSDVRRSYGAVMADLDDDGFLDVVTANYGEANSLYIYNPLSAKFRDLTRQSLPAQLSDKSTHVAVADIDADDDLDLIFTNLGEQNRLYLNAGNGTFDDVTGRTFINGDSTRMPADTWNSTCVLAEDFDGDGDMDLFIANNAQGGEQNRMLINDSLGVFRDNTQRSGFYAANPDQ
ncbi:MAG: FG-GAP-like repeat-containing protein, partial [Gemmatimonadota bacterium]|nr:FG-GAP-like repeat-containing protein [Gemmatimonadota bacterium]